MPKPTLGEVSNAILDPCLSDNYRLTFPTVPVAGRKEMLTFQCKSANKPGVTLNSVEVQVFGHTTEHASNKTWGHDLTVEYVENRELELTKLLEDWTNSARGTQTQHGKFKSEYAVDALFTVYNQKGDTVAEYVIVNCWPSAVPDASFTGESVSVISVSAGFKYDYYYRKGGPDAP